MGKIEDSKKHQLYDKMQFEKQQDRSMVQPGCGLMK